MRADVVMAVPADVAKAMSAVSAMMTGSADVAVAVMAVTHHKA
jgi:hypothetical protein